MEDHDENDLAESALELMRQFYALNDRAKRRRLLEIATEMNATPLPNFVDFKKQIY